MKLLKSEKHRTEKASMIYNWLRTPPQHVYEFHYGFTRLRQEKQQEHVSAVSPQTRQDTKGTCQSQAGTWNLFMHGTLLNTVPHRIHWAFMELFPALLGVPQTCSLQDLLQCSQLLQCLDLFTTESRFLFLPEITKKSEDVSWKKMMLSITYAMASLEPHWAPTTGVMIVDTRICSRNGLR